MKNRGFPVRWGLAALLLLVAGVLVSGVLTGCSGATRATNWTSLTLGDDNVVYAADLGQVRALNTESGAVVWSFPAEENLRAYGPFYNVARTDDTLFVTSQERTGGGFIPQMGGVLRAIGSDGRLSWEFKDAKGEFVAPGAGENGVFVIGNGDGNVYAFNVADGSPAWAQPFACKGRVWSTPLVLSDTVYVTSLDHNLYALDLQTGRERWQFHANGAITGQPLVLNDTLYIGAFDHNLYALRLEDGAPVWQFQGEAWFWASPSTDGARIYAADVNGNIYALDPASGSEIWRSKVSQSIRLAPTPGEAGEDSEDGATLLVAGDTGTLYGLDTSDGFIIWSQVGQGQLGSLAVSGPFFYVTRVHTPERVQAFYVDNGRPLWTYPQPEPGK